MHDFLVWGFAAIAWLQQFQSPALTMLAGAVSFLGDEPLYLLSLPLACWLLEYRQAVPFVLLILASHLLNGVLKEMIAAPRPLVYQPGYGLAAASGPSFPSNHAQTGSLFWLALARLRGTRRAWGGAVLLACLLGLSRLYLGVHFPWDVGAGWLLAGLLLYLSAPLQSLGAVSPRLLPCQWLGAFLAVPLLAGLLPASKDTLAVLATLQGGWLAHLLRLRWGLGDAPCGEKKLFLACGLPLLALLFLGLKWFAPETAGWRWLRYAGTALWALALWPRLFAACRPLKEKQKAP